MPFTQRVTAKGPHTATIAVIGEAPGHHESQQGKPFVGMSGILQERWIRAAGLNPQEIYFDNVYQYQPPKNIIGTINRETLLNSIADLVHVRLASLPNLTCVVPVGNLALAALTGEPYLQTTTKGGWTFKGTGISKRRGSIYWSDDLECKVIPTIHPAAILRGGGASRDADIGFFGVTQQVNWEQRCRMDWLRIAEQSKFKTLPALQRTHIIEPTKDEYHAFISDLSNEDILAIDIETDPGNGIILCVGFSYDPRYSITIPFGTRRWWDAAIKELCAFNCDKTLQNGHYDAYWLKSKASIDIHRWVFDTLAMHHMLDPCEEHSLHFLGSIYTYEPYWKDEGKYESEGRTHREWHQLLQYCGKDACVTRELTDVFLSLIPNIETYYRNYTDLFQPILDVMLHGTQVDLPACQDERERLRTEVMRLRDSLAPYNNGEPLFKLTAKRDKLIYDTVQAGFDPFKFPIQKSKTKFYSDEEIQRSLNTINSKTVSNQELMSLLYTKYAVPPQTKLRKTGNNAGTRTPTIDEVALRKIRLKQGARNADIKAICDIALAHSNKLKLSSFYNVDRVDDDQRIRCTYKFTTETGRFSSSRNPTNTGTNMQNIVRESRNIYIPDKGCIFLEVDLSQAEDRVVKTLAYALTGRRELYDRARATPGTNDEHRVAASIIFNKHQKDINYEERYFGKRVRHASNYGMGGKRFSDEILKDNYEISAKQGQAMIDTLLDKDVPEVREWQQWTRKQIMQHHCLSNSWGLTWDVKYAQLNDDLYRRAYAWRPQSEVGRLLNNYGFAPMSRWLKQAPIAKINLQVHDSLTISVVPAYAYEVAAQLTYFLERPRIYEGVELTIPCEYTLKANWLGGDEKVEFKVLPSESEFTEAAHAVYEAMTQLEGATT